MQVCQLPSGWAGQVGEPITGRKRTLVLYPVSQIELKEYYGNTYDLKRDLDLLEQSFVIKSLGGYSKNLRSEITSKQKYYFYDTGIRNTLLSSFNTLALRDDVGQLWENFIVMERIKNKAYNRIFANFFFWRTYDQKGLITWKNPGVHFEAMKLSGMKKKDKGSKRFHSVLPWLVCGTSRQG